MFYSAHKGVTALLLRVSAILKKARATLKKFEADFSVMDRPDEYYDEEPTGFAKRNTGDAETQLERNKRGYQDTIEEEDIEEKKEP